MRLPTRARRAALAALMLAVIAAAGGFAYTVLDPEAGKAVAARYHGHPVVCCPEVVDLGEAGFDDKLTATFPVRNAGHGPLTIANPRTVPECACMGLERRVGDGYEVVKESVLAPGQEAEFALRFAAVGAVGRPMRIGVRFATNDPDRPEVGVQLVVARIRAGLTTVPPQLVLDDVPVGQAVTRRVEIRDGFDPPRAIHQVRAPGLPEVECRFTPAAGPADRTESGTLVGHLDLTVRAGQPGHFSGAVELEAAGDGPAGVTRVPVAGHAVRLVRLSPSTVTLPLRSDAGLLWAARCLYRPTGAGDAKVSVVSAPDPLDVAVAPGPDGAPGVVTIAVREKFRGEPRAYTVKLKVEAGGRAAEVDVPVTVAP